MWDLWGRCSVAEGNAQEDLKPHLSRPGMLLLETTTLNLCLQLPALWVDARA